MPQRLDRNSMDFVLQHDIDKQNNEQTARTFKHEFGPIRSFPHGLRAATCKVCGRTLAVNHWGKVMGTARSAQCTAKMEN